QIFADVRTYWSPAAVKRVTGKALTGKAANGIIHLINSGAATLDGTGRQSEKGKPVMKPWWKITPTEVDKCLQATEWCPGNVEYFRGGGYSSRFVTLGEMPMTMVRLNLVKGLGPVLQLAEGYTVELPAKSHQALYQRTDPTWPTTWFAPKLTGKGAFRDVYSVMANWGANHGSLSYGHVGHLLITLASLLRIPVCMHNVAEERIFRPSLWAGFGTADMESADYRACANLGPLYGC
nr:L-fucose isomerase [bacterium]